MFVDLDWPLNASSLLSASAELLVTFAREVLFTSPFVCLSVSKIAQTYLTGFHKFCGMAAHGPRKKEAQLILPNPRDAFRGQSRSPNIVSFYMLGILSYCAIVTLTLRRAVFLLFDVKNVLTLKSWSDVTQCHWKWYYSIDCVWFPISVL